MKHKNKVQSFNIPDDIAQLVSSIFDNAVEAELWLSSPIRALNGVTPIEILKTDEGEDEVRAVLNKIESGEFS